MQAILSPFSNLINLDCFQDSPLDRVPPSHLSITKHYPKKPLNEVDYSDRTPLMLLLRVPRLKLDDELYKPTVYVAITVVVETA